MWSRGDSQHGRIPWLRARLAVCLAVVAAGAGLAGCTRQPGDPLAVSPPQAPAGLCASRPRLDRLVLTRDDTLVPGRVGTPAPGPVTVTDHAEVEAVAAALCALPTMPKGIFNCPADLGLSDRLVFSAGSRRFDPVQVDVTGCETVHGLATIRWAARSPGLWRVLATVTGTERAGGQGGTGIAHPAG